MGENIIVADEVPAYVARPEAPPRAAIIVIPEIFGINAGIRSKVDGWARLGYLAIAPDLFWRFAPGVELDPDVPEQLQQAFGYFNQYDADLGVADIATLITWTRAQGAKRTGLVGFCLGGRLAYMAATRTAIDAAVGYYGVMIDTMLDEAKAITKPLALHIAGADHLVSTEAQAAVHAGLDPNPLVTLWDYPGLDHGFAAESGNRRDETGAHIADQRTRDFLAANLL
jgi:carboxymethylenebutenolidase